MFGGSSMEKEVQDMQIEDLRKQLHKLVERKESFADPEVIALSQQLDELLLLALRDR